MSFILDNKKIAIIGLGLSNISVIKFLKKHHMDFVIFDTRDNPPFLNELKSDDKIILGPMSYQRLKDFDTLIVAPGININKEPFVSLKQANVDIIGDIELFALLNKTAKVIAITGSNGKSTVSALCYHIAKRANINVQIGANFGNPVFDIYSPDCQLYVLELSSFELETTSSLNIQSCCILNLSEDHLDRYDGSMDKYTMAKHRIYRHAKNVIYNLDDPRTYPVNTDANLISFAKSNNADFYLKRGDDDIYLYYKDTLLLKSKELKIYGVHNLLNVLSAIALCYSAGIELNICTQACKEFTGLEHRCNFIRSLNNIDFFNDSKATNVASSIAAIEGLAPMYKNGLILLVGGLGKGQDFSCLKEYFTQGLDHLFCYGKDAELFVSLSEQKTTKCKDMYDALHQAYAYAKDNQAILLSPCCASFDEFTGYDQRGKLFVKAVNELK